MRLNGVSQTGLLYDYDANYSSSGVASATNGYDVNTWQLLPGSRTDTLVRVSLVDLNTARRTMFAGTFEEINSATQGVNGTVGGRHDSAVAYDGIGLTFTNAVDGYVLVTRRKGA